MDLVHILLADVAVEMDNEGFHGVRDVIRVVAWLLRRGVGRCLTVSRGWLIVIVRRHGCGCSLRIRVQRSCHSVTAETNGDRVSEKAIRVLHFYSSSVLRLDHQIRNGFVLGLGYGCVRPNRLFFWTTYFYFCVIFDQFVLVDSELGIQ